MVNQILYAAITIVIGVGFAFIYFWGSNWLLDRLLSTENVDGPTSIRRDSLRTRIRPWLFLFPALFFLTVYLVYPVFETIRLTFYDGGGRNFVGSSNWLWALNSPAFVQSLINNALWLIVVPSAATAFGLLVAVLADRLWWGNIAKSMVFMPMAISFVGASVIWKFIYDYRGSGEQIGLLNAAVMAFGGEPQAWITLPFWNNFFLMVILVWIQTGFAMVILSAALRGIPEETIEAARIDGASDIRIFFDIMVPQILPTILVVWTTITIVVLKIFDIVLAMTGGQWDTQVLANLMYDQMFRANHFGHGSVVALVIMIAVLPVMIWNIRQASSEQGTH
ncbi:carbohydrate ABC transporter permease [Pelagibacterium halotolerans]|uniref:ABC alpha-glucoside transporter, inner membrane subunit AglF n=1 Tax=Pelagibacterium halotolerans (strain DSM 22347 / JCM 15775 / CGMCC 1.7692 / B2) TaxID=1082931 RepID=G4RAB9_PELHB|nr:sugar ABC transporter permease [Pelagibacterium halotolerans]AEQ50478.1 ABC alpha-glucoside transporter, inner membrane subunit AglF [Pelagibacterium halotolerans B2]QJR19562.1 sugar ABC transporter permease [Pelagibacterium halotolerans]SDZ87940.1 maltose ABC transporter membrane protein /trehalose ABC transporter membrane protein /sucrose ABC transporter membrane protein [Pelagibacterium halotolerans]